MAKDVIVLEFNELTPALMNRFIAAGHLPNFKKLRDRSIVAVTDAQETPPALEPWIQWVTVHTGLSYAEHKVFHLGDGPALKEKRIWDVVSDAGRPVWICGSMNAASAAKQINGYILPDPWAVDIKPQPAGLFEPYLNLVRTYVQEYTTAKPAVALGDYLRFGRFMLANGLSLKTVMDTMRQLADERRHDSHWARAAILDRLQWDIFRKFYRAKSPALSTFFLNSTAHYQHYFWRNMDPDAFAHRSEADTERKYREAILFGYRKMDEIVGECLALAGPETSIVLCTALSQQPMLEYEEIGGKQIFKPYDQAKLFAFAGIESKYEYAPVMAEQFHLIFADEAAATAAAARIAALRLEDGAELMLVEQDGNRIFSGCKLVAPPMPGTKVVGLASNEAVPFETLFYPVEAVRSGMHHPEGILWIATPEGRHIVVDRAVALTEIAPTLLELAGLDPSAIPGTTLPELAERMEHPRLVA